MKEFQDLVEVTQKLLGPGGCPWDQKQTFLSLQPYILEEAHEVIEAVDSDDTEKMIEELGDLLFTIIFYAKVGEKTNRFSLEQILTCVKEKLIRRHPHVFSDVVVKDESEVMENWEKIKAKEKGKISTSSVGEGIPPSFPILAKAQKVINRILRKDPNFFSEVTEAYMTEQAVGKELIALVAKASKSGVDVEGALRRQLSELT